MDPSRLEMNPYQYAAGNPVMFTDPSGLISRPQDTYGSIKSGSDAEAAWSLIQELKNDHDVDIKVDFGWVYNTQSSSGVELEWLIPFDPSRTDVPCIVVRWEEGKWENSRELELVKEAVEDIEARIGSDAAGRITQGITIKRLEKSLFGDNAHAIFPNRIVLTDAVFNNLPDDQLKAVIIHEFAHQWDWSHAQFLSDELSWTLEINNYTGSSCTSSGPTGCISIVEPKFLTTYAANAPWPTKDVEDFADTFEAYIVGTVYFASDSSRRDFTRANYPLRYEYIERHVRNMR